MPYEPSGRNVREDFYVGSMQAALARSLAAGVDFDDIVTAAQGGGGGGSSGVTVYKKTVTVGGAHSAAQLAAGIEVVALAVGDVIDDVHFLLTTSFDGTAKADFGVFTGSDGLFGFWGAIPDLAGWSPANSGYGVRYGFNPSLKTVLALYAGDGSRPEYGQIHEVRTTDPFQLVISQNGAKGGTPIDSTVGTVDVYVIVHPAVAMVDLDA